MAFFFLNSSANQFLSNSAFAYVCYVIKKTFKTRDNFGKFIHQFQPESKTLIRKLERILIKLYRQNVSLLFNQTCTHTHTLIYIYIYTDTHT